MGNLLTQRNQNGKGKLQYSNGNIYEVDTMVVEMVEMVDVID